MLHRAASAIGIRLERTRAGSFEFASAAGLSSLDLGDGGQHDPGSPAPERGRFKVKHHAEGFAGRLHLCYALPGRA
jgi:hypothetical protein